MKPILLDTSGIVALLDRSEQNHLACADVLTGLSRPLITCEAVIAESCHLLRRLHGAQKTLLKNIQMGMIGLPWRLMGRDLRVAELMYQYQKVPMGFADACLVCMAEDYEAEDILTLDSDFEVYRWSNRKTFNILVDLRTRSKK